jgi:hypothetical protein
MCFQVRRMTRAASGRERRSVLPSVLCALVLCALVATLTGCVPAASAGAGPDDRTAAMMTGASGDDDGAWHGFQCGKRKNAPGSAAETWPGWPPLLVAAGARAALTARTFLGPSPAGSPPVIRPPPPDLHHLSVLRV